MTEETKLIKTDSLGRVRVPKEHREAMLDAFEASAMSGAEFARNHGVPVMTFGSWIQKRRRARGDYDDAEKRKELRISERYKPTNSNWDASPIFHSKFDDLLTSLCSVYSGYVSDNL